MGLNHPIEALLCSPDRYEDYRQIYDHFDEIGIEAEETPIVCKATVLAAENGRPLVRGFGRRGAPAPKGGYKRPDKLELYDPFARSAFRLEIMLKDLSGKHAIQTVFGAVQRWRNIEAGDELFLYGTANRKYGGHLRFDNAKPLNPRQVGTIAPVYLGIAGQVSGELVHKMIHWVLADDARAQQAFIAATEVIRADCGHLSDEDILDICTPKNCGIQPQNLADLLVHLHAPSQSLEEGSDARLIAARICALAMQCRAQRANARAPYPTAPIGMNADGSKSDMLNETRNLIASVEQTRGYALTDNQKSVAQDITSRLQEARPMNGLLSGEVGSGKTLAYALPAVCAWRNGARVAIMAPTTLLADQIARTIAADFEGYVEVERVKSGGKIRHPDAILVGTMGLASVAEKEGYEPNFLIMDEQHKLDTASRMRMVQPFTHTLEVSATPIPRSLALSLYDGMDLFTLNEQPVNRNIQTTLIDVNDRKNATRAITQALADGQRCAVVFARVEPQDFGEGEDENDEQDPSFQLQTQANYARALKSATQSAELFERHFPNQVVLLHGQTPDKAAALDAFRCGDKKLMVTTTIFETGIDVPDVKVLVVRDPQQMGLSQLHQLRGRLARTGGDAHCFLLTEDLNALAPETVQRLSTFCQSTNGYDLAYADMLARGAGDLRSLEQKGKANATFKGIKITAEDLFVNEENHVDLQIEAQAGDTELDEDYAPVVQRQVSMFV